MTFTETVKFILSSNPSPLSPQEIREIIKERYPDLYATDAHQRNVDKGHYKDLDHALLAQIYTLVRTNEAFDCDKNQKPMKITLVEADEVSETLIDDFESETGIVYVLKTDTFTKDGKEIIKIGFTTQPIAQRINQLYTTGVPFKFKVHAQIKTGNYVELEQAFHKLLAPFKLNKSREFFTQDALVFIPQIVEIHKKVMGEA
jgi:hypothetical protein